MLIFLNCVSVAWGSSVEQRIREIWRYKLLPGIGTERGCTVARYGGLETTPDWAITSCLDRNGYS